MTNSNNLENLNEISEKVLSELKADEKLRSKILNTAFDTCIKRRLSPLHISPAFYCFCTFALVLIFSITMLNHQNNLSNDVNVIRTFAAGSSESDSIGVIASGTGLTQQKPALTSSNNNHSIFVNDDYSIPLILINNEYYRMLSTPSEVNVNLLGEKIGQIQQFNEQNVFISNKVSSSCVQEGSPVYRLGNHSIWISAEYNHKMRVFQRISFNDISIHSGQTLLDIAPLNNQILSISLTGFGTVSDPEIISELIELLKNSEFENREYTSSNKYLVIATKAGLSYEFAVKGNNISSCGTWSCPEFFEFLKSVY